MGKNSFMDLGYGGHCQGKIYLPECESGEWSIGFMWSPLPDIDTPEVIEEELAPVRVLAGDILVVDNGGDVIVDKVSGESVAEDKTGQCYQHNSVQGWAGQEPRLQDWNTDITLITTHICLYFNHQFYYSQWSR